VKPPSEGLERDPEPIRKLVPGEALRLPGGLHGCKCRCNSFARSLAHLLPVPNRREPSPTPPSIGCRLKSPNVMRVTRGGHNLPVALP
jgi:hypothetical protein